MKKVRKSSEVVVWYAGYCYVCGKSWEKDDGATPREMKRHAEIFGHTVSVERNTWYDYKVED